MRDCETFLSILHAPEDLRSRTEGERLSRHLEACGACQTRAQRLTEAIAGFLQEPDPVVSPDTLRERVNARIRAEERLGAALADSETFMVHAVGAEQKQGAFAAASDPREWAGVPARWVGGLWRWVTRLGQLENTRYWLPVAAAALLVFVLIMPGKRFTEKGAGSRPLVPTVDLQASVERLDGGDAPALELVEDGRHVDPGDGLLFQFAVEGVAHLALVERDPTHRFSVLYERHDIRADQAQLLRLTGDQGQLLRYVPEGLPGEYVYIAVASAEPFVVDARFLDSVWNRYVDELLSPLERGESSDLVIDPLRIWLDTSSEAPWTSHEGPEKKAD